MCVCEFETVDFRGKHLASQLSKWECQDKRYSSISQATATRPNLVQACQYLELCWIGQLQWQRQLEQADAIIGLTMETIETNVDRCKI